MAAFFLSITQFLLISAFILLFSYLLYYKRKTANLPPGPKGLPLIGYIPFLRENLQHQFKELADQYGEIFSLKLGHKLIIVLNSYESIKEAFVRDVFAGRPVAYEKKNEIMPFLDSEKEVFWDHKRFSLRTLHDFGFGKHTLEPSIKEEIRFLLNKIASLAGQPSDLGELMRMSVSNVVCALLHGKRFDYEDEHFQSLISLIGRHVSHIHPFLRIVYVSLLSKIPGSKYILRSMYANLTETDKLLFAEMKKKIQQRAKTHEYGIRKDFISAWFTEAEDRKKTNTDQHFSDDHLTRTAQTLMVTGTDTTANSLRWCLLYLMAHPDVQTKVQNEIDEVIGHERMPSLSDQDRMPYSAAVIMEIQRISSLVPFGLMHSNFETTKLKNFTIPKRSVVIANIWACHHDPKVFPNPEEFRPERFLDKKGKLIKEDRLIPFSVGKRQCLGESLARMEFFLYFTSLYQRFSFKVPQGEKLSFDYDISVVAIPKPFKVNAIERNN